MSKKTKNYDDLAKSIIKNVGGVGNISSLARCVTRLRFKLKDESKANTDVINRLEGVVTVMKSGGQYQVVIGNKVQYVYDAVMRVGNLGEVADDSDAKMDKNVLNAFIDIVSSIFTPVLGVLAATGMIKGFNALFAAFGWLDPASSTYAILNAIGDTMFYFFPIFLGLTAARKFKLNEFVGIAIGAALVYPTLGGLMNGEAMYTLFQGSMIESPIRATFFGIPVIMMNYSSTVIPIILATYFASKVEKLLKKIIPDVVKMFLVPAFTLLIVVPATLIVIGPISTWAGQLLGVATLAIYDFSPVLMSILMGGFWQIFVMFGLHWGLVPIAFNNMMVLGGDPILAATFGASFAQIGAVLAILIKTKDKKLKGLALPSFVTGIFGITEPAIYGITLPRKKAFLMSCVAAAISGGIIGFTGVQTHMFAGMGVFGYTGFIDPATNSISGMVTMIVISVVAVVLGFALTWLFGYKGEVEVEAKAQEKAALLNKVSIKSPMSGEVKLLEEIEDSAFGSGSMGKGIAILATDGKVTSPVNGTVATVFPTKHAIGITSDEGVEVLIHIGMNTVQLEGKYFEAKVKAGDQVKVGQLLVEFDRAAIEKAGFSLVSPIVVTNSDQYLDVLEIGEGSIRNQDEALTVLV